MHLNTKSSSSADMLEQAVQRLDTGDCVAIPTETVYGLAGDATNGKAVASIFEIKGRPSFNPLICHVDGITMAREHGKFSQTALKLAEAFWPGPLTLVVPREQGSPVHSLVTAELATIGLRHPKGLATTLITRFGKPLAAPSANRSGKISPTMPDHVRTEFANIDLLVLDGPACDVGIESTILKVEGNELVLLRPGAITPEMIGDITGIKVSLPDNDTIQAPGMMKSHYAPDAQVILGGIDCPSNAAWLQFGGAHSHDGPVKNLSPSGDLREAAANLYGMLKELDLSGCSRICVSPIPESGLGIAINDRLRRAAAPRDHT